MDCKYCKAAERHPTVDGVTDMFCRSCQARRIANSPAAAVALSGNPQPMRDAIAGVWKDDYEAGRTAVWEWMERIKAWKAKEST